MSFFGPGNLQSFPQDLIDEINREIETGVNGAREWIDNQIHEAAKGLLNSMLPPLIRANIALVKTSESTNIITAGGIIEFTLSTADISNTVLAGAVAEKVKEGIGDLRWSNDYTRGVNSITW